MRSENDYSSIAPNGPRISITRLVKVSTEVASNDEKKKDREMKIRVEGIKKAGIPLNLISLISSILYGASWTRFLTQFCFQCSKCKLG